MKIAVIGNVTHPLHDPYHRGVERFTRGLAKKLAQRGHDTVLFTAFQSRMEHKEASHLKLSPILGPEENERMARLARNNFFKGQLSHNQQNIEEIKTNGYIQVMKEIARGGYDLVHNNSYDIVPLLASSRINIPMLTTFHAPPGPEHKELFQKEPERARSYFCAGSRRLQALWKQVAKGFDIAVINGACLDTGEEISLNLMRPKNKALWVGRICPEKGLHKAIQACHLAGVALNISGPVADRDYFENVIIPLMGAGDEYIGDLGGKSLKAQMENSRVGLITNGKDDPLPLSAIEMLFAGLPIAAFSSCALEEVITPANGKLAREEDPRMLANAISQVKDLCRVKIQQEALRRRSLEALTVKYEKVYEFLKARHEQNRKEQTYWHLYTSSRKGTMG